MRTQQQRRAAESPEFRVEIFYEEEDGHQFRAGPFMLDFTQLVREVRDWSKNPDYRAFDRQYDTVPLFVDRYEDVTGNQVQAEMFVSHTDGSPLTGDEIEALARSGAEGTLPVSRLSKDDRQQRLPLSAKTVTERNPKISKENPMRTHKPRRVVRRPHGRTARKFGQRGIGRNRPGTLSPAAKEIQLLQEQLQQGEIDAEEFETRMEELEARSRHSNVARALIARARQTAARTAEGPNDYFDTIEFRAKEALDRYWDESDDSDLIPALSDIRDVAREGMTHRYASTRTAARRNAAIDPADVVLLNNAIKQLSKTQDADHAVRMLRDIIDASQEMMQELGG